MSVNELLNEAHDLSPAEKLFLIESLIQDLNLIDENIEKIWIDESIKRLESYENGKLQTVSIKEVFSDVKY